MDGAAHTPRPRDTAPIEPLQINLFGEYSIKGLTTFVIEDLQGHIYDTNGRIYYRSLGLSIDMFLGGPQQKRQPTIVSYQNNPLT